MPNRMQTEGPRERTVVLPVPRTKPPRLPRRAGHGSVIVPAPAAKKSRPVARFGETKSLVAKQYVFQEDHPADSIFLIERGVVLTYRMTIQGHRRIVGIHTAGDLLGLTAEGAYRLSSQCVTPVAVRVFERADFLARVNRRDRASRFVWPSIFKEYLRSQEHIVRLGTSAMERVAGFILSMADRNYRTDSVQLTITRRDMADYLGMTIETVSRMLTVLKNEGAIRIENVHTIWIANRAILEHRSGES